MATRIQLRRDTAANWNSFNPVLAQGEFGLDLDSNKIKLGDGTSTWSQLQYENWSLDLNDLDGVTITDVQNGDFLRYNSSASAWINDPVNLSTDTVGDYVQSLVAGTGVTVTNNSGEGTTPTIAIGQAVGTSSSVTFAHVSADITGNVTGNADTADSLSTARAISLAGDLSGSVSFDGSSNVTITANVQPDSIALGADTTGNYVSDVTAGTGVTVTHTPGEGSSPTIAIGQAVGTSSSVTFAHVSADVTGDITGNADTATALQTARVIELSGDVSGSASFDGTSAINITTVVNTSSVAIGELGGVSIVDPVEYQVIQYDGTVWRNEYPDTVTNVRNVDTVTLNPGVAVYLFGGTGDHASVKRADNSSDETSSKTVGLVGGNGITVNNDGPVVTRGYVDGVDLSVGYNVGDVLWLGKNGAFTTTKPSAPDHLVFIGVVVRATNNGIIYVSTQNGYELEELHNVKINGVTDGQFLRYNSASTVWVNDTINLGSDTAGDYVQSLVAGTGVTLSNNSGESATPTIAIGQSVATSASVTFAHVSADLTGNVTGNSGTATSLETARAISLAGDLSGSVSFNGTSDVTITAEIQPNSVALGTDTTGNYVSDVTAGTGVTVTHTPGEGSSPTIAIGQAVGTSSSVQFGQVTTTGDVVVGGNLTVNGTQTVLNTDVLAVEDNFVILNAGVSGAPTLNAGINVNRGSSPDVSIFWNEDADSWKATEDGTNFYDIAFGQNVFTSSSVQFANVTSNLLGDVTGKADRADRLEVGRTISLAGDLSGSVAFDGTQNVTLNATIQSNSVTLGSDTTGSYVESLVAGTGITLSNNSGESATPTVAIGQDVGTSASVTFANVTADLIGNVTGNASTATALQNTRTISLSGDVTGSASFNGSSDTTIVVTIPADSIVLGTDTTGNYVADVTAGTGIGVSHIDGEGSAPEISLNAYLNDINDVNLTVAPTDGQFLKYVSASTAWIAANIPTINSLDDIADVTITSASVSQVLQWNGTAWINANPGATATVSDTAPGSPTEGDLWFDSTTLDTFVRYDSAWIQLNDSGSSIEVLDDLFDVSVLDAEPDQFLKYDGTDWVPASPVLPVSINTRTTNYTLTLSDVNRLVEMNLSGANTVTVPTNANQAIPIGSKIEIFQYGSGKTQIIGDTGVTIRTTPGSYLNSQYSYATLVKRGTNEWILFGDLSAS